MSISVLALAAGGACTCSSALSCTLPVDRYGFLIWIAILAYMFKLLGVIGDHYFAPCLETISRRFNLSADVAGATFMAMGSSAPELFTAILTTFVIQSEGGVGTILGSAIFNMLVIVGTTGVIACKDRELLINWYPLTRDCSFYAVAIAELIWVLDDEVVDLVDSIVLVGSYFLYCLYMRQNLKIKVYLGLEEPPEVEIPFEPQDDRWHVITEEGVPVRNEPSISGKETGYVLEPGETFYVYQELDGVDNILYLRLNDGRGWVHDRVPGTEDYLCLRDEAWHDREEALKAQRQTEKLNAYKSEGGNRMDWHFHKPNGANGERSGTPNGTHGTPHSTSNGAGPVLLGKATLGGTETTVDPSLGGSSGSRFHPNGANGGTSNGEAPPQGPWKDRIDAFLGRLQLRNFGVLGEQLTEKGKLKLIGKPPDHETAVVDPAGLHHFEEGPRGNGGASGAIYQWLGIANDDSFPEHVKRGMDQTMQAKFHSYAEKKKVIHVICPDLRDERYQGGQHNTVERDLAIAYHNALLQFVESGLPRLRFLPLSSGFYAGEYVEDMADLTLMALCAGFKQLDSRTRRKVERAESLEMCIFLEADLEGFKQSFAYGSPPVEVLPDISRASGLLTRTFGSSLELESQSEDPELGGLLERKEQDVDAFDFLTKDPVAHCWECSAAFFGVTPEGNCWIVCLSSLIAVGACSFLMVDAVDRLGCSFNVPPLVMGMLFLSAGASVPDALGSIAVAKQGEGDMAVANALGSNVFDIMLGLGLPWLISNLIDEQVRFPGARAQFLEAIITLIIALTLFVGVLILNKWKMNRLMGFMLLILYFIYVIYYIVRVATS